jgi:hypothetical protein
MKQKSLNVVHGPYREKNICEYINNPTATFDILLIF